MSQGQTPAGWYHAEGDPQGTTRYWDGSQWVGEPQASTPAAAMPPGIDPMNTPPMTTPAMGGGIGAGGWSGVTAPRLTEAGARIGGRVLDGLVWGIIGLAVNLPNIVSTVGEAIEAAEDGVDPVDVEISATSIIVTGLISTALIVAYEVFMNSRTKGTLGKRAISSKIVKEDGSDLDDRTALMRMVPYIGIQLLGIVTGVLFSDVGSVGSFVLGSPFWIVALIGLIMLFADSRRQTPWDKVGRTLVVRR